MTDPSLGEMCTEYVDLLNSPPNGWGQHIHPRHGQSHLMLRVICTRFGTEETNAKIAEIFVATASSVGAP